MHHVWNYLYQILTITGTNFISAKWSKHTKPVESTVWDICLLLKSFKYRANTDFEDEAIHLEGEHIYYVDKHVSSVTTEEEKYLAGTLFSTFRLYWIHSICSYKLTFSWSARRCSWVMWLLNILHCLVHDQPAQVNSTTALWFVLYWRCSQLTHL